jgi:4-hydroxybenzoate polyprenyltransferase
MIKNYINYLHLIRFNKPIGTLLLLYPTLWALWIATNGHPPILLVVVFSLGVFLTRSAGCAINDYADNEFDKHVTRTQNRPIASGALSKKSALFICILLSLCAFILAISFLHWQTILLSVPALLLFITYPFMKRYIAIPQAYLGTAYSFGILMVFMETTGTIANPVIWFLFFANLCWVIGYDTIYAMVDIEDDLKIGIKTSAITFGSYVAVWVGLCYTLFIILMVIAILTSYNGTFTTSNLEFYLMSDVFHWIGIFVGTILLVKQMWVLITKRKELYFKMFLLNNWVGLSLLLSIIINSIMANTI